jgi:subfamily B ATP-binding cassette protein MsbA
MATKKISRKDAAKMSNLQLLRAGMEPYKRLLSYLRPYRGRFLLGMIFGVLFGIANGAVVLLLRGVIPYIFPDGKAQPLKAPNWLPFQLPEISPHAATTWEVVAICATIPALFAIRGLFSYMNAYCLLWVSQRTSGSRSSGICSRSRWNFSIGPSRVSWCKPSSTRPGWRKRP